MREYEIINPSDSVTILADDINIARMATLMLGQGHYGLEDCKSGETVLGFYFLGTAERLEAELTEMGLWPMQTYIDANKPALAACLRTAMIGRGGVEARKLITDLTAWNELKRTSLNDICAKATHQAESLEKS